MSEPIPEIRILFLDIDGVLNGHEKQENGYCGIHPYCASQLNTVLERTGCLLVISSAWRYLILEGSMTVKGFESLLLVGGVKAHGRVFGYTRADKNLSDKHERGKQIAEFVKLYREQHGPLRYVVLDDDDEIGIPEAGHPFVKTDGKTGLTPDDVAKTIAMMLR